MENGLRLREAQQVHASILTNGRMIGQALVDMACLLKRMRDEKLYEELGRGSFEEYVKEDVGLGVRQAYNYIQTYERLQPELLARYSGAGITKLQLLCEISAPEREEFAEEADLANITVAELQKLVEEKNGLHEQLSFLSQERQEEEALDAKLRAETAEKMRQLEEEVARLRAEPVAVGVKEIIKEDPEAAAKIAKLEEDLAAEALRGKKRLEEAEAAKKEALQKAKEAHLKELENVRKAAEKKGREAAEDEAAQAAQKRTEENKALLEELESLRKKAAAGSAMASKEMAEFAVLLKKVQEDLRRMKEIAAGCKDAGQAEKLGRAMAALREAI